MNVSFLRNSRTVDMVKNSTQPGHFMTALNLIVMLQPFPGLSKMISNVYFNPLIFPKSVELRVVPFMF